MRVLYYILFVLGTFNSFGQNREVVHESDTLLVRGENIATNPFNFGRDPLTYLNSKIKLSKPTVKRRLVENQHVANDIDTIYTITFGRDSFVVYVWDKGQNALLTSDISTERFITRHGIKIDMTKTQIKNLLKGYEIQIIPRYLILENIDGTDLLTFEFKKDILKRIQFQGYFD